MSNSKIFYDNAFKNASSYFDKVLEGNGISISNSSDPTVIVTFEAPETITWGTSSGDSIYCGKFNSKFSSLTLFQEITSTAVDFTNRDLQYWNGSAWTSLTHVKVDFSSSSLNRYDLPFVWDIPTDWAKTGIGGAVAYWVRLINTGAATGTLTINAILQQTVVSTCAELGFPQENLINESVRGATFRSRYETFEIITGQNDTIDYVEDGNTRSVTIPGGYYLGEEVAAQLNESTDQYSITWTYDKDLEKFSTTKSDAGTYTIKWADGANKSRSLGQTLGFDCSANSTGATTYTADFYSKSTGARFIIDSSNKDLKYNDGSTRTMSLVEGSYNAKSLATALKYKMDTVSSATNFDWQFDEYIGYFKTKRASGTYTIQFTDPTSSQLNDTLGQTTPDATMGASYTALVNKRIHTAVDVYFCMPSRKAALSYRAVLAFFNLQLGATVCEFQRLTTTSFTQTFDFSANFGVIPGYVHDTSSDNTDSSVWRLRMTMRDTSANYIELGYCFVNNSTVDLGKLPMQTGNEFTNISYSDKQVSPSGHFKGNARNRSKRRTFTYDHLPSSIISSVDTLEDEVQDVGIFYFMIDETNNTSTEVMLARFAELPSFAYIRITAAEKYNTTLKLLEAI